MIRSVFSIVLFCSLFACKKNEQKIKFEGKISDYNTATPASGVTLKIYYQEIGNGSFSTAYKFLAATSSNANGEYSLEFEKVSAASFRFELSSSRDFTSVYTVNADQISSKETNTKNFTIESKSWFCIRIHNTTPVSVQDEIIYQNSGPSDCNECCNTTPHIYSGMSVDTTFYCMKKGGKNMDFNFSVTKASINNQYTQSLYCAPYDTTYFYLSY